MSYSGTLGFKKCKRKRLPSIQKFHAKEIQYFEYFDTVFRNDATISHKFKPFS